MSAAMSASNISTTVIPDDDMPDLEPTADIDGGAAPAGTRRTLGCAPSYDVDAHESTPDAVFSTMARPMAAQLAETDSFGEPTTAARHALAVNAFQRGAAMRRMVCKQGRSSWGLRPEHVVGMIEESDCVDIRPFVLVLRTNSGVAPFLPHGHPQVRLLGAFQTYKAAAAAEATWLSAKDEEGRGLGGAVGIARACLDFVIVPGPEGRPGGDRVQRHFGQLRRLRDLVYRLTMLIPRAQQVIAETGTIRLPENAVLGRRAMVMALKPFLVGEGIKGGGAAAAAVAAARAKAPGGGTAGDERADSLATAAAAEHAAAESRRRVARLCGIDEAAISEAAISEAAISEARSPADYVDLNTFPSSADPGQGLMFLNIIPDVVTQASDAQFTALQALIDAVLRVLKMPATEEWRVQPRAPAFNDDIARPFVRFLPLLVQGPPTSPAVVATVRGPVTQVVQHLVQDFETFSICLGGWFNTRFPDRSQASRLFHEELHQELMGSASKAGAGRTTKQQAPSSPAAKEEEEKTAAEEQERGQERARAMGIDCPGVPPGLAASIRRQISELRAKYGVTLRPHGATTGLASFLQRHASENKKGHHQGTKSTRSTKKKKKGRH